VNRHSLISRYDDPELVDPDCTPLVTLSETPLTVLAKTDPNGARALMSRALDLKEKELAITIAREVDETMRTVGEQAAVVIRQAIASNPGASSFGVRQRVREGDHSGWFGGQREKRWVEVEITAWVR